MNDRQLALAWIEAFCEPDLDALEGMMSADLRFVGPWYRCSTRADYLQSLRRDPPAPAGFDLVSVIPDGLGTVAAFYVYRKGGAAVTMGQLFRCRAGLVHEILLVFDGRQP